MQIAGANFRLYSPPSYGNLNAAEPRTVQVWFDGVEAADVLVLSATDLEVVPPAYTGDADQTTFPAVDVKVQNVEDDGTLIATEEATATAAYTYIREALRPPTLEIESPFVRISRQLLHLLKRQVMLDVSLRTHTDFSADGLILPDAPIPSLSISGPTITQDAYGWENAQIEDTLGSGFADIYPNPIMHTVSYEMIGRSDNEAEYQRMMGVARKFCWQNPYLVISGDVPADSTIRLPLVMTDEPQVQAGTLNANLHTFVASFEIRRVPVLYLPPYLRTVEVATLQLETQTVTGTLVETINL